MALTTNTTAILFATLTSPEPGNSSSVTDWLNKQKFTQALSIISEAVFSNRGVVTKRFDDGILGTFAESSQALKALMDIDRNLDSHEDRTDIELPVRIALHYTQLHVIAGNVAGEGLDATVQLALTAEPGEIRVSADMYEALRTSPASASLSFVEIHPGPGLLSTGYSVQITDRDEDQDSPTEPLTAAPFTTDTAKNSAAVEAAPPTPTEVPKSAGKLNRVQLQIGDQSFELDSQKNRFTVGRGKENNARIRGTHVSREHGHFEFRDDGIYFLDHSSNGSCLLRETGDTPIHQGETLLELPAEVCLAPDRSKAPEQLIVVTQS